MPEFGAEGTQDVSGHEQADEQHVAAESREGLVGSSSEPERYTENEVEIHERVAAEASTASKVVGELEGLILAKKSGQRAAGEEAGSELEEDHSAIDRVKGLLAAELARRTTRAQQFRSAREAEQAEKRERST